MQKGTPQILAFTGTAVHGGGSCQVSITYDNPPTATSKFKVIHSIQGGCPARNAAGNLGNDPNAINPDEYEFKIPTDLPSGNATLAWTWLNKIGLREFYMQCASIEIEGEGGSQAAFDALPDMFIANIPQGEGCKTEERKDILYPDPGNSVEKVEGPDKDFAPPICSKAPAHQATEAAIASPAVTGTVLAIRGRRAISRRS
ncbi:uncharacterized protein CTHT_0029290 [Thermochaetoides thermophila DSM 1495]|uniref:Uncharacterized protein n=1 Tax=Chaetomium thermophilum (strain DSM 1495 / CBS 144.50 / IMI 039719) TaxID=759272 RepID=G0S841_CHATD|nr:hypothetical protein CTHT_0029290 [Thermochaetoides thermophila DSM 1495]EGS21088.1 hypothetical protein CTHT_0029290 [Thermochaetoides thermophila DSM 1495]